MYFCLGVLILDIFMTVITVVLSVRKIFLSMLLDQKLLASPCDMSVVSLEAVIVN